MFYSEITSKRQIVDVIRPIRYMDTLKLSWPKQKIIRAPLVLRGFGLGPLKSIDYYRSVNNWQAAKHQIEHIENEVLGPISSEKESQLSVTQPTLAAKTENSEKGPPRLPPLPDKEPDIEIPAAFKKNTVANILSEYTTEIKSSPVKNTRKTVFDTDIVDKKEAAK